jgi:predicted nucleic acid-binding Zn ribbon protein
MTVRLPPHKHCPNCDDPIAEDQDYCSEECRTTSQSKRTKTNRRNMLFYIIAIAVLIGVWLISYVL